MGEKHEAEQFLRVFEHVKSLSDTSVGDTTAEESRLSKRLSELMPKEYNPGFAFVVVQKRINTRVLAINRRGPKADYSNPPPGTILDHTVTRFKYKDFFLVPQSVNQGTVTPTHFILLKELGTEPSSNGQNIS